MGVRPGDWRDVPGQRHGQLSLRSGPTGAAGPWTGLALVGFCAFLIAALLLPAPAAAQSSSPSIVRWNNRPEIRAGFFRAALIARLQLDVPSSPSIAEAGDTTAIDVTRRRIGVEGRITSALEYEIEAETSDPDDRWRDVFVNLAQWRFAEVKAGKFKLPFSLDENTSSMSLDFVHRSRAAVLLAPGRDVGVMVHGRLAGSVFRYELGTFDHDGSNSRPVPGSPRLFGGRTRAGRVGVAPFNGRETPLSDLLVSFAWTRSELEEGFSSIRGDTVFNADFYDSDYWVRGPRRRVGLEFRWRPGPLSVKSEFIRVTEHRLGQSVEDTDLSPLRATGWYLSGTWAMTGEAKADGLDNPRRPFLQGGPGAIEVAARIENLRFDSTARTGEAPSTSARADVIVGNANRVLTFGVNWYLNRWIKVQFNLVRETIADPAQGPLPGQPSFWSRILRMQFAL